MKVPYVTSTQVNNETFSPADNLTLVGESPASFSLSFQNVLSKCTVIHLQ